MDKNYVLFLFQIYQYNDGVRDCCQQLNLRQELLTFYIHHGQTKEVFEWCRNPGVSQNLDGQKDRAQQDADLWIQALTYFRELKDNRVDRDKYIKMSLDHIGKNKILSPLLVLEIFGSAADMKFEVIKDFLVEKLKEQQQVIRGNLEGSTNSKQEVEKQGVKQMTEHIETMREDIQRMKRTSKNFDQKDCNACGQELKLPTVHFLCGHVYHEYCAEGDMIKKCHLHAPGFDDKARLKETFKAQAHDAD